MTTNNLLNYFLIHLNGLKEKTKTRKAKSFAYLCMTFACFMITSNATGQVTIGSNVSPEGGSILDLKEFAAKSQNQTSDKGVVLPRVLLTNKNELYPMYWNTSTSSEQTEYTNNKAELKKKHVGMTVFNLTNTGDFVIGVHIWTGTEWRKIDDSPVIQPQITSLICSSSQMTPNTYTANVPFEGILKVPYLGGNGSASDTAVDNFTFINDLEDYNTIVYNQIISIPSQAQQQRDLDKKKRKHEGAANNSPSNAIIANEINDLLHNIAADGELIVNAHFSIIFSTNSLEMMETTQSLIENKLFTKGIITSKNSENQLELFRSGIPGNAVELREYDLFMTTSEAALSFFFKESYPVNEDSNFYLRFTDRQGVPLKIDPADLPMNTGRINNRNKFVLGPSGSGKSFLMNNIVEQYLTYNYDVVIVDTGDSYSGTCKYKGGKYIQYTEEKPITMNPFLVSKKEFNIEKIDFLSNLIFLIWQGADSEMTSNQKSILDNVLLSYYHQFFNTGNNWYAHKNTDELLTHLEKYNIHKEDIISEFSLYTSILILKMYSFYYFSPVF